MLCINRILRNQAAECATKEFAETANGTFRGRFRIPNSSGAGVEKLNAKSKKVTFFLINQVYHFKICT